MLLGRLFTIIVLQIKSQGTKIVLREPTVGAQAARILKSFKHPPLVIQPDIEQLILLIYEDLSRDDLLIKCLGGHTQNANESFNATVHSGVK